MIIVFDTLALLLMVLICGISFASGDKDLGVAWLCACLWCIKGLLEDIKNKL